jgi:hypothetical protein
MKVLSENPKYWTILISLPNVSVYNVRESQITISPGFTSTDTIGPYRLVATLLTPSTVNVSLLRGRPNDISINKMVIGNVSMGPYTEMYSGNPISGQGNK